MRCVVLGGVDAAAATGLDAGDVGGEVVELHVGAWAVSDVALPLEADQPGVVGIGDVCSVRQVGELASESIVTS